MSLVAPPVQSTAPSIPGRMTAAVRRVIGEPSAAIRALLTIALVVSAVVFIGWGPLGGSLLRVVIAVGISVALFVGLNRLFDVAFTDWTMFTTIVGVIVGALGTLALAGNRILTNSIPSGLWALLGGVAVGGLVLATRVRMPDELRPLLSAAGWAAIGLVLAFATVGSARPGIDWPKFLITLAVGIGIGALRQARSGSDRNPVRTIGWWAIAGWLIGLWGGADIGGGNVAEAMLGWVVPFAAAGYLLGLAGTPTATQRRMVEQKSRSWIFATPAVLFVAAGLIIPLVITIIQSFEQDSSAGGIGTDNYARIFSGRSGTDFVNFEKWSNMFTSRLTFIAAGLLLIALVIGVVNGRQAKGVFQRSPASSGFVGAAFFVAACAVLASLRGTMFNNIWWVIVVTTLTTALGLLVAVLADRAKGENVAKSLIFLPMAISFVGAGIIWRYMYQSRNQRDDQTGLLNAIWVGLGELSNSGWQLILVAVLLAAVIIALIALAVTSGRAGLTSRAAISGGSALLLAILFWRLVGPGIGGFRIAGNGEVRADPVDFLTDRPFNNMWMMVVLIWLQTGFAMVIFSSAIKGVPSELTEAATIDGANESQTFWRVIVPQIMPTVAVVVTTLVVLVMKVFDVVQVMTGGQLDTQVIANQMFEASNNRNTGSAAALATMLFLAVLPVMFINARRMQKEA